MTLEARLGCQAGSAATAQEEAAGAQPEPRGTGRRGPGTADPGERPCHGEAGGRAGGTALEHGRFPTGPHRQSLPPTHARLPRTRYRVSRGETGAEDANSRGPRSVGAGRTARCTWSLPSLSPAMRALLVFWRGSWNNRSPQVWGPLPGPHLPSTWLETDRRVATKFSVPSGASSAAESAGRSVGAPRFPSVCRPLLGPHPLDPFVSSLSPSSYYIPWTTILFPYHPH